MATDDIPALPDIVQIPGTDEGPKPVTLHLRLVRSLHEHDRDLELRTRRELRKIGLRVIVDRSLWGGPSR